MKKVLLLGLAVSFLTSCYKEVTPPSEETVEEDCFCDRVVGIKKFYIVGDAQSNDPSGSYYCPITTINDCNKMQKNRAFSFKHESSIPKVGDCFDMGI